VAYAVPVAVGAYLVASLNVAIVVFRLTGRGDPRTQKSGNPGVVNVYRVMGPRWAALVLILDVARAAAVGVAALWLLPAPAVPAAGLALVLGNRYPLFHGFRGGKGVAAYLGFTGAVSPIAAAASAGAWVVVYSIVRLPFVGSFVMVAVLAVGTAARFNWDPLAMAGVGVTAAVIVVAHRGNLVEYRKRKAGASDGEG
jgi:glycerol-3-phosphate acyltransferase PlsY